MHRCPEVGEIARLIARELDASETKAAAAANASKAQCCMYCGRPKRSCSRCSSPCREMRSRDRYTVSTPATRFFFPSTVWFKGVQETPDNAEVGSFPQVFSKDAKDRRSRSSRRPTSERVLGPTASRRHRTVVSRYQNPGESIRPQFIPLCLSDDHQLLASNPNTLQCFCVDYPLSRAAHEVIHTLPNLRTLLVVIEY